MTKKKEAVEQIDHVEPTSVQEAISKAKKTPQAFADKYNELVKEFGYQIAFVPQWKQSMDTGTFSLVIQMSVIETPKEK
jgi:hypothetical protein